MTHLIERRLARLERYINDTDVPAARYIPIQVEGQPARVPPLLCTPFDYVAVVAELTQGNSNAPHDPTP